MERSIMSNKNWKELFSRSLEQDGFNSEEVQRIFLIDMKATKFFYFEDVIPKCMELENIEREEREIRYYWRSHSEQAECPNCHEISYHKRKDCQSKSVQDVSNGGQAINHEVTLNRFYCDNNDCEVKIFVERFYEFTGEKARKTHRFIKHCKELALISGSLAAEREIRREGSKVSNDSIMRYLKAEAAEVIKSNLTRDNVKILSIDDFNTRKGDSSSGCTVFIDQETHKVLIIVKGTTKEAVQKIIEKFPSSIFLSRDRACSLSSAGDACGKKQVADRYHLTENIHKAVYEALAAEIPTNIFFKEGDGWVSITQESDTKEIFSVPEEDIEKRIQLAGLSIDKAEKYRNTLKMLEMSERGIRTADIANALELPYNKVKDLRRSAATTIQDVQDKINQRIKKYPKNLDGRGRVPADGNLKTLGANPGPARESIVEPYREIVVDMWNAGCSPAKIHPVIKEKGFSGCKNAVYQYIWKLENEDPCVLSRMITRRNPGTPWVDGFNKAEAENLPELSLKKTTRNLVYKNILKECKSVREANAEVKKGNDSNIGDKEGNDSDVGDKEEKGSHVGIEKTTGSYADVIKEEDDSAKLKSKKPAMAKYSPLEPEYLDLMYGKDDDQSKDESTPENMVDKQKCKKKRVMKKQKTHTL